MPHCIFYSRQAVFEKYHTYAVGHAFFTFLSNSNIADYYILGGKTLPDCGFVVFLAHHCNSAGDCKLSLLIRPSLLWQYPSVCSRGTALCNLSLFMTELWRKTFLQKLEESVYLFYSPSKWCTLTLNKLLVTNKLYFGVLLKFCFRIMKQ